MKTGPHLQQARHPPLDLDPPGGRFGYPAEDFKKSRLPRAVSPNDPDPVPLLDFERDVLESPEVFGRR
jgi:hypothetical protein